MNKIFFLTGFVLITGFLFSTKKLAAQDENGIITIIPHHYKWEKIVKPGNGSFQESWKEGKWPMGIIPVIGFENKLWMSGGMQNWDNFKNDVWFSSDGKKWEKVVEKAKWQARIKHNTVVFKNKLWLIGGAVSSGKSNQVPTRFFSDVWSSQDGINWKKELATAPWPARHDAKVFVFKDKLWLIGGAGLNDVWFSSNGVQWAQLNEHAPWSTRTTDCSVTFKNKLWIFSGKTGREDSWAGEIWTLEHKSDHQIP